MARAAPKPPRSWPASRSTRPATASTRTRSSRTCTTPVSSRAGCCTCARWACCGPTRTGRLTAIGVPMGVIAAIIPVTNPTSTALFKCLAAVKSGNAIVHAPHPRAARCCTPGGGGHGRGRGAGRRPGGPGLLPGDPDVSRPPRADAPPGCRPRPRHRRAGMVRAAYSSGKPTFAVGAGNVPVYIDRSCRRRRGRRDDHHLQVVRQRHGLRRRAVRRRSTTRSPRSLASFAEHGATSWTRAAGRAGRGAVPRPRRPAARGRRASRRSSSPAHRGRGPTATRVLGAEHGRRRPAAPALGRDPRPRAVVLPGRRPRRRLPSVAARSSRFGGEGHTLGLHADRRRRHRPLAALPAGGSSSTPRACSAAWASADDRPSFMLGTGTWSGSIVSDNVTPLHLINIKRVAHEVRPWRTSTTRHGASAGDRDDQPSLGVRQRVPDVARGPRRGVTCDGRAAIARIGIDLGTARSCSPS